MIFIKNLKIFNCSINESFHWSKLPKMKKLLKEKIIKFPYGADLTGAYLTGAYLTGAYLRGADLTGAYLTGADLTGADEEKIEIKDFMCVQGLGSQDRTTYIFETEIGIVIKCGCFFGTEKEFKKKVRETHDKNQYAKEYTEMLKLAHIRFSRKED